MAKHTPGPWYISGTPGEYHREHIVTEGGFCVATVHQRDTQAGRPDPREELLANSDLIGAAPDLLEALKFSVSVHRAQGLIDLSERMAVEKAEAAIKKAERP